MKIQRYLLAAILVFTGCASENQKTALRKVADIYGTKTTHAKGVHTSNNGPASKYFKITLGYSDLVNSLSTGEVTANIALTVYENLSEKEKENLTQIQVELAVKDSTGKNVFRVFQLSDLAPPARQAWIFDAFSDACVSGDYEALIQLVKPSSRNEEVALIASDYFRNAIEKNGKVTGYKRTGLYLFILDSGERRFVYKGLLIFENGKEVEYTVQTFENPDTPYLSDYHLNSPL